MDEPDVELGQRSVAELVAMVVRVPEPASELLARAGGLAALARADALEIGAWLDRRDLDAVERPAHVPRSSRAVMGKARSLAAAFELGRRLERERSSSAERLASAAEVAAWAGPRIGALAHEELWMLALDGRGHLRAARCVAKGGLHGAAVRASDPIRCALRADASAFVLVHNHPSGDPTPSREDILLTARVAAAGRVVGMTLLDHVVVARTGYACVPVSEDDVTPPIERLEAHS